MSKHWWTGPDFLRREETHWPIIGKLMSTDLKDLEVRNVQVHWTTVTDNPTIKFLEYYSQWNHFKRALAWFLRLKDILKTKIQGKDAVKINSAQNVGSQCLSVDELERAENAVISYVQNSSFHEEVEALQKGKQVKLTSNISSLDPILENGILRVGGRFNKMAMPISQQHPAILPKNSHISRLIMRHIHQTLGHSGRNHVLSKLRQHYWIPSANSLARRTIKECVLCRRLQGKAGEQKMADLRAERITPDLSPFTHVGIDYFGPIEVKKGRGTAKRYGVIFTCLVSRAIHLEVANSLDTDACINALRRFICRRGPVATIRTDQASLSQSSEGRSSAISAAETRNSPVLPQLCQEMENLADIIRDFKRENISEHSTLTVVARRRRILHSAITALNKGYFDWHKRPQIEFVGEMADDYGGPTREFFSFVEDHDRMTSLNIMGNASKTLWTNKINFILLLFTFVVKLIIFEWMPQDDPR
ncbi:hypothetical protein SRHO_G00339820 [Serrasalmus rhombeus]